MSCVLGAALVGIDGVAVEVETRISSLLPRVDIVGLADAAVRESVARVRAAIASAFDGLAIDGAGFDGPGSDGPGFDGLSGSVILGRIVSRPPVAVVARSGAYFEPCIYSGP